MTQSILSSLSSDEVNSYSDTSESMQVSEIIRQTYFNLVSRAQLPVSKEIFQLTPSADASLPVLMYRPDNISNIEWIKYFDASSTSDTNSDFIHDLNVDLTQLAESTDSPPSFKYVQVLAPQQFIDMINTFNTEEDDVETYTFNDGTSSFNLSYKSNKTPQYCTVLKNYYILFDSFDVSLENTLQASKTMCYGETIPYYTLSDNFIPDLDDYQFPLLLNEAKSLAFLELKQTTHPKAEQETRRQWSNVQKNKSLVNKPTAFNQLPNFGRR